MSVLDLDGSPATDVPVRLYPVSQRHESFWTGHLAGCSNWIDEATTDELGQASIAAAAGIALARRGGLAAWALLRGDNDASLALQLERFAEVEVTVEGALGPLPAPVLIRESTSRMVIGEGRCVPGVATRILVPRETGTQVVELAGVFSTRVEREIPNGASRAWIAAPEAGSLRVEVSDPLRGAVIVAVPTTSRQGVEELLEDPIHTRMTGSNSTSVCFECVEAMSPIRVLAVDPATSFSGDIHVLADAEAYVAKGDLTSILLSGNRSLKPTEDRRPSEALIAGRLSTTSLFEPSVMEVTLASPEQPAESMSLTVPVSGEGVFEIRGKPSIRQCYREMRIVTAGHAPQILTLDFEQDVILDLGVISLLPIEPVAAGRLVGFDEIKHPISLQLQAEGGLVQVRDNMRSLLLGDGRFAFWITEDWARSRLQVRAKSLHGFVSGQSEWFEPGEKALHIPLLEAGVIEVKCCPPEQPSRDLTNLNVLTPYFLILEPESGQRSNCRASKDAVFRSDVVAAGPATLELRHRAMQGVLWEHQCVVEPGVVKQIAGPDLDAITFTTTVRVSSADGALMPPLLTVLDATTGRLWGATGSDFKTDIAAGVLNNWGAAERIQSIPSEVPQNTVVVHHWAPIVVELKAPGHVTEVRVLSGGELNARLSRLNSMHVTVVAPQGRASSSWMVALGGAGWPVYSLLEGHEGVVCADRKSMSGIKLFAVEYDGSVTQQSITIQEESRNRWQLVVGE